MYNYVCRSLFKTDRLMFALHMAHGMRPEMFGEKEWDLFTGTIVTNQRADTSGVPNWVEPERAQAVTQLKVGFFHKFIVLSPCMFKWKPMEVRVDVVHSQAVLPNLYNDLRLDDTSMWSSFGRSSRCEEDFPSSLAKRITPFQQLLVVQATRPDRLKSAQERFVFKALSEYFPLEINPFF